MSYAATAQTVPTPAGVPPANALPTAASPAAATPAAASIGAVSILQGNASVTRNNATASLKLHDEIFKGDILKTGANTSLGVTFDDETTFNLTANASITVDDFVYQDGGSKNAAAFRFVQGTVAFAAAAVAKTGNMTMTTPSASLGIRGTTGLVEVGQNPSAASGNDAIKLYPDADGKVGRIEVTGRDGASLGVLSRGATGLSIQRGMGARVIATPLQISPQQAARDQGIVRQVHTAQQVGRSIVAERRTQRAAPAQPGQRRPTQAPSPARPGAQPARPGAQPARPGAQPARPSTPPVTTPPGVKKIAAPRPNLRPNLPRSKLPGLSPPRKR